MIKKANTAGTCQHGSIVIPLGTMGWIPAHHSQTCCYCFELGDSLVILDAGTGMSRFNEPEMIKFIQKFTTIFLFLSHYHLDHIIGIFYMSHCFRGKDVHIAGPGKILYGKSTAGILSQIISFPFSARSLEKYPMNLNIHDLVPGENNICNIKVDTIVQTHSNPSLGIKINDSICYCTDTVCSGATAGFANRCRILLHECWYDSTDYQRLSAQATASEAASKALASHSHVTGVSRIAVDAGVQTLALIHLNPEYDTQRLAEMENEARQNFPKTVLAKDLVPISIS